MKGRSLARRTVDPDAASMGSNKFAAEVQAQAKADRSLLSFICRLIKPVKNTLQLIFLNARSRIVDKYFNKPFDAILHPDGNAAALRRELKRVSDEIAQYLTQPDAIKYR